MRSSRTSNRAVSLHVALIVFVPGCVALTWWQASRALSGNTLSWVYTFEWPIFAAYAVFMWWKLLHDEPAPGAGEVPTVADTGAEVGSGAGEGSGAGDRDGEEREPDEELAAYNRYLAELNASEKQKRW